MDEFRGKCFIHNPFKWRVVGTSQRKYASWFNESRFPQDCTRLVL